MAQTKEEIAARKHAYYVAHREERVAKQRAYRAAHREKFNANQRAYVETHREQYREHQRTYEERNRETRNARLRDHERRTAYLRSRRTREMENGGTHTSKEWHALCAWFGNVCLRCGAATGLSRDHVVPVTKGGTNDIGNLQPLCTACNHQKHVQEIDYRDPARLAAFLETLRNDD